MCITNHSTASRWMGLANRDRVAIFGTLMFDALWSYQWARKLVEQTIVHSACPYECLVISLKLDYTSMRARLPSFVARSAPNQYQPLVGLTWPAAPRAGCQGTSPAAAACRRLRSRAARAGPARGSMATGGDAGADVSEPGHAAHGSIAASARDAPPLPWAGDGWCWRRMARFLNHGRDWQVRRGSCSRSKRPLRPATAPAAGVLLDRDIARLAHSNKQH